MSDLTPTPTPQAENRDADHAVSHNVSLCLTSPAIGDTIAPGEVLTDRQRLAVELILAGKSDAVVAREVSVSRRTVCRWRHTDSEFIAELNRRRKARWDGVADRLRELLDPAVDVLAQQLADRYEPTRYRAATALLRLAGIKTAVKLDEDDEGNAGASGS
jgi:hypothetical protein